MLRKQIAQDDDGFEIASLRSSFDIDLEDPTTNSDLETGGGGNKKPPAYDAPRDHRREASPLPAPVPTKPTPLPRESLDGETIFALGDRDSEEEESEGEDDVGERKRFVR